MQVISRFSGLRFAGLAALAATLAVSVPVLAADPSESFSARVVNFEEPMGRAPGLLQVRVTRWSTDADRDALTRH